MERSAAYYRTEAGKNKKRKLNRKRYLRVRHQVSKGPIQDNLIKQDKVSRYESILVYVCMVTSLIEGRRVGCDELLRRLKQIPRQHPFEYIHELDYDVYTLNKSPPYGVNCDG